MSIVDTVRFKEYVRNVNKLAHWFIAVPLIMGLVANSLLAFFIPYDVLATHGTVHSDSSVFNGQSPESSEPQSSDAALPPPAENANSSSATTSQNSEVLGASTTTESHTTTSVGLDEIAPESSLSSTTDAGLSGGATLSPDAASSTDSEPKSVIADSAESDSDFLDSEGKMKKNPAVPVTDELARVKARLEKQGMSQEIIDRIDSFKTAYEQGRERDGPPSLMERVVGFVDYLTGNTDDQKAKDDALENVKKQPFKIESATSDIVQRNASDFNSSFPGHQEKDTFQEKVRNFIEKGSLKGDKFKTKGKEDGAPLSWLWGTPAEAAGVDDPALYLGESGEIKFSQAIKDKANALGNSPLSMLNFVRNSVEYVPYYGSKKGADATLIERAGNDFDQSSLLIAMLRYSSIPARYRHIDAQMDVATVTDLLGVTSATAAAQILTLTGIPYILFSDNAGAPQFFVIEHAYVEAYIPYGYSRGADINDGGEKQWVPMDPSMNAYYYEQLVDIANSMESGGFSFTTFFDNYLNGQYIALEPVAAFKQEVTAYLLAHPPVNYPAFTYADALTRRYAKDQNLDFIPGSLPYFNAADLGTYDYVPTSLRHTIAFTVKNADQSLALSYSAYVSDLADKEILMTYDAATPADQTFINSFATLYDVVPLSAAHVKPTIKINGAVITQGSTGVAMGLTQSYSLAFSVPNRVIGATVSSSIVDTTQKNIITGSTDATALDTDRVVPPELRPASDVTTTSFAGSQRLYRTALDYLYRLESTQKELSRVIGGDYTDTASRATIFNGIAVTMQSGQPYSFSWKGLNIDSSVHVKYFNRFTANTALYKDEFARVFGLQASEDESDIFFDDFGVQAISTVKGLKLVTTGQMPGVTLKKINTSNESQIDTLSVSTATKSAFHTAVQGGATLYTPTAPITYGAWNGLLYISANSTSGAYGYIIGEGLNGAYTACTLPGQPLAGLEPQSLFTLLFGIPEAYATSQCVWTQGAVDTATKSPSSVQTSLISPLPGTTLTIGQSFTVVLQYIATILGVQTTWTEQHIVTPTETGSIVLSTPGGSGGSVGVNSKPNPYGLTNYESRLIENGEQCDSIYGYTSKFRCVYGRAGSKPEMIVIHFTAGPNSDSALQQLELDNNSAHYIIEKNGKVIQQVLEEDIARHAGVDQDQIRDRIIKPNDRAIGIEIVNRGFVSSSMPGAVFFPWQPHSNYPINNYWDPYTQAQYDSLKTLINGIKTTWNIQKVVYKPSPINYQPNPTSSGSNIDNLSLFNGLLGHSVISDDRADPGPIFDWSKVIAP